MRAPFAALAALALAVPAAPAHAAPPAYVTAFSSVYVYGDVTVVRGGTLTLVNLDGFAHDLISSDYENGAPLFQSANVPNRGDSSPVFGVEALPNGIWPFYCSLHESMRGTITVRDLP